MRASPARLVLLCLLAPSALRSQEPAGPESYREAASRILEAARVEPFAWRRLAELSDTFGHRLAGEASLDAALGWAAEQMKQDGLENVRLEKLKVPR